MGGITGKYSRSPFTLVNEEKNYAYALMQEGIPVTDDDENAGRLQLLHQFRRGNQLFGNYGTPNDGFLIQEALSPADNFKITGGGPSNTDIEAAGRFFMRGHQCVLMHDVDYYNDLSDISKQSIHPRITRVYWNGATHTVVEDSAANWVATELVGRYVRIDGVNYTITSNGTASFEISGNHTAAISNLDYYILLLSIPGGARADGVYLNVYVDEYDENDDSTIEKQIGGVAVVAQLRAKIIQTLFVRQDVTTHGELVDYVDSDGNQHYVFKLATIARTATASITTAIITNHAPTIGFTSIGLDHMTPLHASAQSPAAATVAVSPGVALTGAGTSIITFAGGNSPTIPGQAVNERYDALVLQNGGTLALVAGTPGAPSAAKPLFTGVPIAFIKVDEDPAVITDADITDARCLFTQGLVAIADLAAATAVASADLIGIVQGGVPKKITVANAGLTWPYPPHHIHGLIMSPYSYDEDGSILISSGGARDSTNVDNMDFSGIIKQVGVAWAVGDTSGGLDALPLQSNTLYAVWLIKRSDTGVVDALVSTSFTAPTMPADYDLKRLIGAFKTDGNTDIVPFRQSGDQFEYVGNTGTAPPTDINDDAMTENTWKTGTLISVPPHCRAHILGYLENVTVTTQGWGRLFIRSRPSDALQSWPVQSVKAFAIIAMSAPFDEVAARGSLMVNSAQQVDYACSQGDGDATVYITVLGFEMLTRRDPQ